MRARNNSVGRNSSSTGNAFPWTFWVIILPLAILILAVLVGPVLKGGCWIPP